MILTTVSLGLYMDFLDDLFLIQAAQEGQQVAGLSMSQFMSIALRFRVLDAFYLAFTWTAICAVKFSFLWFFKKLIHRVRQLEILWYG